jgi:hypothetical protein
MTKLHNTVENCYLTTFDHSMDFAEDRCDVDVSSRRREAPGNGDSLPDCLGFRADRLGFCCGPGFRVLGFRV